jgi:hypothetical protein
MDEPQATQAKRPVTGAEIFLGGLGSLIPTVGEKRNYNFQPEVTEYELWPFSTIEWVADQNKYQARAIVKHKVTGNTIAFHSWHQDFADAERAIALLSDSLGGIGPRRVYNIFGETIAVHTADVGGGKLITVSEVLALIWSMMQAPSP